MVSEHIEALVQSGRLEAQGNTKNWRISSIGPAGHPSFGPRVRTLGGGPGQMSDVSPVFEVSEQRRWS